MPYLEKTSLKGENAHEKLRDRVAAVPNEGQPQERKRGNDGGRDQAQLVAARRRRLAGVAHADGEDEEEEGQRVVQLHLLVVEGEAEAEGGLEHGRHWVGPVRHIPVIWWLVIDN